jgi:hypothetical protein
MSTEVIILAQGTQQRLGSAVGYKQLLPLPACGGVPLIARTLRQVVVCSAGTPLRTVLVTWEPIRAQLERLRAIAGFPGLFGRVEFCTLADPGNSSLRGLSRYLEQQPADRGYERTVVLLGDVVYSWVCLDALWLRSSHPARWSQHSFASYAFAGTTDLSAGGGELWGVAWHRSEEQRMRAELADALLRHPPFEDTYQPGQLRRWISGMRRGELRDHVARLRANRSYCDIEDYTMDVDLPEHVRKLDYVSACAEADDRRIGITWTGQWAQW